MFNIYIFLYSGFGSFLSSALGLGSWVLDNSDDITFAIGILYLTFFYFRKKIRVCKITLFIFGYILLRGGFLIGFALFYDYSVVAYLIPLKNWFALLYFFIIGNSLDLSFDKINKILLTIFILFVLTSLLFSILTLFIDIEADFSASRLPFLKYRIPIDIFLTTYIYMVSTLRFFAKKLPFSRYFIVMIFIILAILLSQIQQMMIAILLVSIFLLYKKIGHIQRTRFIYYFFTLFIIISVVTLSVYFYYTIFYSSIYLSIFRRNLLIDYVVGKIAQYPIAGYPIPSPAFSENIPYELWTYFFDFRFDSTIFPADIPFLFLLSEEGVIGVIYVIFLLLLCYKRNPETKYVLYLILATITNFRLYYLITLASSFTYFLLGYFTKTGKKP